jgi:hypothetical protein
MFLTVYHALLKIFESYEIQVATSKVGQIFPLSVKDLEKSGKKVNREKKEQMF